MSFNFERKIIVFFPINKQLLVFCSIFTLFCALSASAQPSKQDYLDYIDRYKPVALQYEQEYGVPASITLAQGILESYAGKSRMAREANNHFGIKAYHWKGEVYGRCDSLNQVGYRKYGSPEDSFLDHARFLKGPRYSVLYELDVNDYRSWAQGLRDCGYAEDINYPAKLISIIERYELYAINSGTLMDDDTVIAAAEPEPEHEKGSSRWHHRKRRSHSQTPAMQEPSQEEHYTTYTPARQGRVASSADND